MTAAPNAGAASGDAAVAGAAAFRAEGAAPGRDAASHPHSILLVRVAADRIEISEHLTHDRTAALVRALRQLGVSGEIIFRTPCG